jgi:hypothetical protein
MLLNDAFILTLAYPETIELHPEGWYAKFIRFFLSEVKRLSERVMPP